MIIKKRSIEKSSFRVCLKFLSIMILRLPLTCQMAQEEELLVWLFNTNNRKVNAANAFNEIIKYSLI